MTRNERWTVGGAFEGNPAMHEDDLWAAIDTQRHRTVDLLESLPPGDWDRPSLCDGWLVRDVAAHLTLQQLTLGSVLVRVLRHPRILGPVNHVIHESARIEARHPTEQLIARIRAMIGSRRHNLGVTPQETLIDIVVHGQDIAIPLDRTLAVDPEVAAVAARRVWSYRLTRRQRSKAKVFRSLPLQGHRLVATDADWSTGEGPELRGPALSLLLLLTGRTAGRAGLTGPGAHTVRSAVPGMPR
jgi:uncharacterized protein (TIGR03083 family)